MADKGEIIKRLREQKNMTQDQLAERLNVTKQTVFKYEKGIITNIPSDKIENMADIFGVSPLVILGREPIPDTSYKWLEEAYKKASPSVQKAVRLMLGIDEK